MTPLYPAGVYAPLPRFSKKTQTNIAPSATRSTASARSREVPIITVAWSSKGIPPRHQPTRFLTSVLLPKKIHFRQVDDFVAPAAQDRFEQEEGEPLCLGSGDRRRNGQLLAADDRLYQRRAVMPKRLLDHWPDLIRRFRGQPEQTSGFGHLGEARVVQIRSELEEARGLHLELHERKRVVAENDHLHRCPQLPQRQQIPHQHRQPAVARQGDHLTAGVTHLSTDCLRQR